ncbi:MAG: hypothetical protein AAB319_01780 [Pseudomonadota bacterium]
MKHKIHRIHFVAEHARRRGRASLGRLRCCKPRPADTDEASHEA